MNRLERWFRDMMADPERRGEAFRLAWILSLIFLAFGYFVIFYVLTQRGG